MTTADVYRMPAGERVCVVGRLTGIRTTPTRIFAEVQDDKDYIHVEIVGDESYNEFKTCGIGEFIKIEGIVRRSSKLKKLFNRVSIWAIAKSSYRTSKCKKLYIRADSVALVAHRRLDDAPTTPDNA